MYYEDCEPYYEPTVADEILMEFQQKMKDALLESVKFQIEDIKTENERLKEENKQLKDNKYKVDRKEKELQEKEKTLERSFYGKKFSELLKPFEENYSGYYAESTWNMVKKCNHCDENRKIDYTSVNGDIIKQNCSCNKSYRKYIPKHTVIEVLNLYKPGDTYKMEFGITPEYHDRNDDDRRWSKLKFTQFIDTFDESTADALENRDILFKNKEECKKYCDWINKQNEQSSVSNGSKAKK